MLIFAILLIVVDMASLLLRERSHGETHGPPAKSECSGAKFTLIYEVGNLENGTYHFNKLADVIIDYMKSKKR